MNKPEELVDDPDDTLTSEDLELVEFSKPKLKKIDFSNDKALFPLNFKEACSLCITLLKAAVTTIGSEMLYCLNDFILMYYIGHMNKPSYIAAVGLGNIWSNSACLSLIFSLDSGFSTLASQAFGAKNSKKIGELYQKSFFLYFLLMVPLFILLAISDVIFLAVGIEEESAILAGKYIRWRMIGYVFVVAFEITATMLRSQNIFSVGVYTQISTTILGWALCHITQRIFQLDLLGFAIVKITVEFMNFLILFIYIKLKKPCQEIWDLPWKIPSCKELWEYFVSLLSFAAPRYFEMISWELNLLILGTLGSASVTAAHALMMNIAYWCYTFPAGLSIAAGVYIGNSAGENNSYKTKMFSFLSVTLNLLVIGIIIGILNLLKERLLNYYTDEMSVQEILSGMMIIYSFMYIPDSFAVILSRILRTVGQPKFILCNSLIWSYCIGFPFEYFVGVRILNSYQGIWIGMTLAVTGGVISMIFKVNKVDWKDEVKKIHEEMKGKDNDKL